MKRPLVLCCAVMSLAGCNDGSSPTGAGARFDLVLVDDKALPVVLQTFLSGSTHRIIQGDAILGGGIATQRAHYDSYQTSGASEPTVFDSTGDSYVRSGSQIVITRHLGSSVVEDTGYIDSGMLIMRQQLKSSLGSFSGPKHTLKYQPH